MLIAVDVDNILADDVGAFCRYHNAKYKTNLKREQFFSWHWWTVMKEPREEVIKKHSDFLKTIYFKDMPLIPGAKKGVAALKEKHDLVILTGRPKRIVDITKKWLNKNFGNAFKELYCTDYHLFNDGKLNKGIIIRKHKIRVLIDDFIEHGEECPSSTQVLLFNSPWNQKEKLHNNFTRVYSWPEIVRVIERL